MDSSRVYTSEARRDVEHDRNFVKQARERRRVLHMVAKEQRARARRINEERSFAFWVRKMQRKAQSIMTQHLRRGDLVPKDAIRL